MRRTLCPGGLAGLLLLTLTRVLPASSVALLTESTLVDASGIIVRASVLSSETRFRSGPVGIYTDVTLDILEVLKGSHSEPTLHVALPGGEIDGRRIHVSGVPAFVPGEEVVVFLGKLGNGQWTPLGLGQGKYRLEVDTSTGLTLATRDTAHLGLVIPSLPGRTRAQALRAAASNQENWDLFRRRILQRVGGSR